MTESEKNENRLKNRTMEMELVYKCCDCGKDVKINLGELLFLHDNGLRISKRCKDCKEKKNEKFKKG